MVLAGQTSSYCDVKQMLEYVLVQKPMATLQVYRLGCPRSSILLRTHTVVYECELAVAVFLVHRYHCYSNTTAQPLMLILFDLQVISAMCGMLTQLQQLHSFGFNQKIFRGSLLPCLGEANPASFSWRDGGGGGGGEVLFPALLIHGHQFPLVLSFVVHIC